MRVLVTGGAGFVGSHIVDELVALGHRVRVVDRLHPRAHAGRPDYLRGEVEYLEADLGGTVVDAALDGVEAVCHQAAMVGLGRDFADAPAYVRDNDLATAVLLAALHRRRGQVGRLVLGGSMVVYGEGGYRCRAHGPVRPARRGSRWRSARRRRRTPAACTWRPSSTRSTCACPASARADRR